MSKINQEIAQKIIDEYMAGASSYDLADRYGIWQTSICNLIRGKTWKSCTRPENIHEIIRSRREKGLLEGRKSHKDLPPLSSLQKDILVGSLLGDGYITKQHGKGNCSFVKKQAIDRKAYLEWHIDSFGDYASELFSVYSDKKAVEGPGGKIQRIKVPKYLAGYGFTTFRHPNITQFRTEWYVHKRKIIPSNISLNARRIAIWYFDDGANNESARIAVLCTQSFTFEEVEFLSQKLSAFELRPKIEKVISKHTDLPMPILKFTRESYDNLIDLVKPFMAWDCFAHKICWHRAKQQWEYSGKFSEEQAREIIRLRQTKPAKEIAKIYGVHVNTIYALVSGRSWKHLHQKQ